MKSQLECYGYVFSVNGISADTRKVDAIKTVEIPKIVSVRSLLNMTNYVGSFLPNFNHYSTIKGPHLKNVHFEWDNNEQESFKTLKRDLTSNKVMSYFYATKLTAMIVDASLLGLGALVTQDGKVILYGSRAIYDVETRYFQTEKDALAVVLGCEHFHLYMFGDQLKIISDQKPLEHIFNNPNPHPLVMIERCELHYKENSSEGTYFSDDQ